MRDAGAVTDKARAEVENVIEEVVQTIRNGVSRPDGRVGFRAREAKQLQVRLRLFAETIVETARGTPRETMPADLGASIDDVVATIRSGVVQPDERVAFGASEADELRSNLRDFAGAIVAAARDQMRTPIDAPIDNVVRTIRSGLFHVYGREAFAAITADQLDAYLRTFVDAVLALVEKDGSRGGKPPARSSVPPG